MSHPMPGIFCIDDLVLMSVASKLFHSTTLTSIRPSPKQLLQMHRNTGLLPCQATGLELSWKGTSQNLSKSLWLRWLVLLSLSVTNKSEHVWKQINDSDKDFMRWTVTLRPIWSFPWEPHSWTSMDEQKKIANEPCLASQHISTS